MINNCPCCNKYPKVNVTVSCENKKCLEFDVEYYVWTWQAKTKPEPGTEELCLD